jgi:hypothetical protein
MLQSIQAQFPQIHLGFADVTNAAALDSVSAAIARCAADYPAVMQHCCFIGTSESAEGRAILAAVPGGEPLSSTTSGICLMQTGERYDDEWGSAGHDVMRCTGYAIILNSALFDDSTEHVAILADAIARGHYGPWNTNAAATFVHEFGHAIELVIRRYADDTTYQAWTAFKFATLVATWQDAPTDYARQNQQERFAECFAAWQLGDETYQALPPVQATAAFLQSIQL